MAQTVAYFCLYRTKVKPETLVTKKQLPNYCILTWNHCAEDFDCGNSNTKLIGFIQLEIK